MTSNYLHSCVLPLIVGLVVDLQISAKARGEAGKAGGAFGKRTFRVEELVSCILFCLCRKEVIVFWCRSRRVGAGDTGTGDTGTLISSVTRFTASNNEICADNQIKHPTDTAEGMAHYRHD